MTTVVIDGVRTIDAQPSAAPYRISAHAGHDTALVGFHAEDVAAADAPAPDVGVEIDDTAGPDEGIEIDPTLEVRDGIEPGGGTIPPIVGYSIRVGGVDVGTGVGVNARAVCGDLPCGEVVCSDFAIAAEQNIEADVAYANLPAGGDRTESLSVYVQTEGVGWA